MAQQQQLFSDSGNDGAAVVDVQIISYNMHGFNQGRHTVRDLSHSLAPDVFLLQEHWLTPANMSRFEDEFFTFICFGSSAMNAAVESGVLYGRPFGGVMTLVSRRLQKCTQVVCAAERFVVVIVGNYLVINVYLPCAGTPDRLLICEDVLSMLSDYIHRYAGYTVVMGGDFNCDLNVVNSASDLIKQFMVDFGLIRCDSLFAKNGPFLSTFYAETRLLQSTIDYFLVEDKDAVYSFQVLDPDSNLSDHRPISMCCKCAVDATNTVESPDQSDSNTSVSLLRWDYGDLNLYRYTTGIHLQAVLQELLQIDNCSTTNTAQIDMIYDKIIQILSYAAGYCIPSYKKNFLKHWWDNELDDFKSRSVASCRVWKAAGRPRSGPVFTQYRKDKSAYRSSIRKRQLLETEFYTNDLHDALIKKQGKQFWKCWASKFEHNNKSTRPSLVNGIVDSKKIAEQFACYFAKTCTNSSAAGAQRLIGHYERLRRVYCGNSTREDHMFDAELVENVISKLKCGKAAGLDGISAEHLQNCHAILPGILAKLFNAMVSLGYVPMAFGQSFTVPVLKNRNTVYSKSVTVDDFRGISISPVLSKVFEHCVLNRYCDYFVTSNNQFGFKKNSSCSQAIYSMRCTIDHYVSLGSTVNVCAIDITKAFDKMNHHGLFIKLMERHIPSNILCLLENWFAIGVTCVKWFSTFSGFFSLPCGIRQGGVLSPYLFALYIDGIVKKIESAKVGCYVRQTCLGVLLYADDIVLMAPTVSALQQLLYICESELDWLDLRINASKSAVMRIGPRYASPCCDIITTDNRELNWAEGIKYLGVYIDKGRTWSCSLKPAKQAFYRAFNSIFGKIGRVAPENVVIDLLKCKCLPALLYSLEACRLKKAQIKSLNLVVCVVLSVRYSIRVHQRLPLIVCKYLTVTILRLYY